MIFRVCARTLVLFLFGSPTFADEYVCSDFKHVSRVTIAFVAERQGLDWSSEDYRASNFEAALTAGSGTFFISSGTRPSNRVIRCLGYAEELTPGINEAFDNLVSQLGEQAPPAVVNMILSSLPEDKRDEHTDIFVPTLSAGKSVVYEAWTTKVIATMVEEPDRSLIAIDSILGQRSHCLGRQKCYEAFAKSFGEN